MTRLTVLLLAVLLLLPAAAPRAQEAEPSDGVGSLLEDGANRLLRGLIEEVEPAIDQIAGISAELLPTFRLLAQEMGPAFVEVIGRIDSISNYEPPAILPNGDIILRRSPDAPRWVPVDRDRPETEL